MEPAQHALQQSPRWSRGQLVRVRGDRWRIEAARVFPACQLLQLVGIGRTNLGRRSVLLWPFDRPQAIDRGQGRRVTWRRWLHAFRALVARATPCGRLRTAATAVMDLHAYQLEPALAVLEGAATRLLLADEVGLGKTIEAGLILAELRARDQASRTLVLTPAGLCDQWAGELRRRFSIDAVAVDAALLRRTLAQIAAGTNPWSIWPVAVASLDFVKRPDVLRALEPFTWDALLVDEAHQCAVAPERSAAVQTLAARARHVVLLTATPHAGDDDAFDALCRIGRLGAADRPVMFRRNRTDVGLATTRRVHRIRVPCTGAERRMHRLLDRYSRAVWTSGQATPDARLAMIVLRKRSLSSAASLARSLERRLEVLFNVPAPAAQLVLPFAGEATPDEQTMEDEESAACLAAPGMDGHRERDWLLHVLEAARAAAAAQSKVRHLIRLLRRARQPAVIFTEYRDTARWLTAVLAGHGRVALLHGGLSRIERREVERQFRTGEADTLVATDAAGEGLNLHHRCRLVVNLELPWNPMRLEQRIGRVDRLGQARPPHAVHLVARDTVEEQIVWRLIARQERARQSIGAIADILGAVRERDVAAAVMEGAAGRSIAVRAEPAALRQAHGDPEPRRPSTLLGTTPSLSRRRGVEGRTAGSARAFTTIDVRDRAADEVRRLARVQDLLRGRAFVSPHGRTAVLAVAGPCIARLPRRAARRSRLAPGLVCVFAVRLTTRLNEAIDERIVVLRVDLRPGAPAGNAVLERPPVLQVLKGAALASCSAELRSAAAVHRRAMAAAGAREEGLAARDRVSPIAFQPGMFDRRALVESEQRARERASREFERNERVSALDGTGASLVAQAELELVLVVPGPGT